MVEIISRLCSFICHQLPDKTYHFQGDFLPLCFRCTGVYSGFLTGFLFQLCGRRRKGKELPPASISLLALVFILATAIDALLREDGNYLRFSSGLLTGTSISIFLLPIVNYLFLKSPQNTSIIDKWSSYLRLLAVVLLLSGTIFINLRVVFLFLWIGSVFGLILLYLLLAALVLKRAGEILRSILTKAKNK